MPQISGNRYRPAEVIDHRQVKMARSGLDLSVRDLADLAGVNKATIVRLEAGMSVRPSTLQTIREALETAGAVFLRDGHSRIAVSIARPRDKQS